MDDQPLQLRAVTALLAKHYQVYTAQSGIEAIRLLENMAVGGQLNRLQAILLDVTMPELNGLAILELIRARYPRMPIIICSAHQERSVILNARQRGASDYLLKPYTSEVLLQKLSKHISQTTNG
ncbi:MAG: response regulator [Caldilineaceae bacterium]